MDKTKFVRTTLFLTPLLALLLVACTPAITDPYPAPPATGGVVEGEGSAPPQGSLTALPLVPELIITEESMTGTPPPILAGFEGLVDLARTDLAQRLGIAAEEIEVLEARAVVWPDGSLGCPRPGLLYPQVQVEGARILLAVGKQKYAYHSGGGRAPFLCENLGDAPPPAGSPGFDQ
jgi:hypothetical protein